MFGKKDHAEIKTLIAQGTRIDGALKFREGLRVDGEVYGPIEAAASEGSLLVISEGAVVEGGVTADRVIIAGTVRGPVIARESLELQPRARIDGDVQYLLLEVQQGATIAGRLGPLGASGVSSDQDRPSIRLAASAG